MVTPQQAQKKHFSSAWTFIPICHLMINCKHSGTMADSCRAVRLVSRYCESVFRPCLVARPFRYNSWTFSSKISIMRNWGCSTAVLIKFNKHFEPDWGSLCYACNQESTRLVPVCGIYPSHVFLRFLRKLAHSVHSEHRNFALKLTLLAVPVNRHLNSQLCSFVYWPCACATYKQH